MFTIKVTDEFSAWIDSIKDGMTTQAQDIAAAKKLAATIED